MNEAIFAAHSVSTEQVELTPDRVAVMVDVIHGSPNTAVDLRHGEERRCRHENSFDPAQVGVLLGDASSQPRYLPPHPSECLGYLFHSEGAEARSATSVAQRSRAGHRAQRTRRHPQMAVFALRDSPLNRTPAGWALRRTASWIYARCCPSEQRNEDSGYVNAVVPRYAL